MDRKDMSFMECAAWFEALSSIEKDMARLLMLTSQRDYGFYFDRALVIVCESYLDAKANQAKQKDLEMSEETIEALRRELNGKKGN